MLTLDISYIAIITIKVDYIVLFMTLVNLKQLIYWKIMYLMIMDIYKNAYQRNQFYKSGLHLSFWQFRKSKK